MAVFTKTQLVGLNTLMFPRIYPQRCLQKEFLALSMAVKSIDTQIARVMRRSRIPPRSLNGRRTAPILYRARKNQFRCWPHDSSIRRCRRISVLSSLTSPSSSRRSFEESISVFPPQRPSNCRCRSRFDSSCDAVLARREGLEIEGAVLISLIGSSAKPVDVYRTYRQIPKVIRMPRAKPRARSPSTTDQ